MPGHARARPGSTRADLLGPRPSVWWSGPSNTPSGHVEALHRVVNNPGRAYREWNMEGRT